jgi:hypothetical protein
VSNKVWRGFACALLLLACVTGCAQNENAARKSAAERISKEEVARREAARPQIGTPAQPPRMEVVPSRGTCAPPADNLTFFGSCCNDKPCNGQCVAAGQGKIACSCFGVAGGCSQGKVCCKLRRGCVLPKDCEAP